MGNTKSLPFESVARKKYLPLDIISGPMENRVKSFTTDKTPFLIKRPSIDMIS
jgi:hypothetical protein